MNAKFQAEMKELDEKFAAISEDAKRRYDRHRFIRRAIMTYWSSTFVVSYLFYILASYMESFFISNGIELPPEIFSYIWDAVKIVVPICATIYVLRRSKTKRYSYLFVRDQRASFLAFRIENFASIVLILYPILLILGSFFARGGEYGVYAFLYGLVAAPICLLVFAVCYSLNISSYEPAPEGADLRRESGLAAQSAKSAEERLCELNDLDAEFDQIPWHLKNRYDVHRLIRRASMAFIGFTLMVSWFAGFIENILGVAYLAVVLILPYIFTKIYLKSYPTKKYSRFFIKNQRLCLAIFTVENLASIALILYPIALIVAALIARNNEKTVSLLLGGSNVLSACLIIFTACYLFNRSTYIPKDET